MARTTFDRGDMWVPVDAVPIARYNGDETHARMAVVSLGCIPLETDRLRNLRTTVACASRPSREINVRV